MGLEQGKASLTPSAIRNTEPQRVWLRGYRRADVHRLLDDVADELAAAIRGRDELFARHERLEAEVAQHRELAAGLGAALVSAEHASQEAKAQARRESDLIVREAHAEARRTTRQAEAERRQLELGITDLQARLRAVLGVLDTSPEPVPAMDETSPGRLAADRHPTKGSITSGAREIVA